MKLRALRLTNFRQHAATSIAFSDGITGIVGPNGAGKTTILEAISWALYGNEAARGRRDTIRFARAEAKAQVRVELEFELAGHQYRVVRGLSSAEVYLDGGQAPIANSLTSASEVLQRRIGMSRGEFFNTYFTGQKELAVMTSLGPTERAQFLSRVLGYERLRDAQSLVRERRRDLNGELTGVRSTMPDPVAVELIWNEAGARVTTTATAAGASRAARTKAEQRLATLAPKWESAQLDQKVRQQLDTDLQLADHDLEGKTRDAERAASALRDAEVAVVEREQLERDIAPRAGLLAERDSLDVLARDEGKRQALTDSVAAARTELASQGRRRTELADAPRIEQELTVALDGKRTALAGIDSQLTSARDTWARDRQEADTRRNELRKQYAEVNEQRERIVEAGEDGICPTCQRPLGANFRGVLDALDVQLEDLKVNGTYYKSRVEQLTPVPAEITALDTQRKIVSAEAVALERRVGKVQQSAQELAELDRTMGRQEQRLATHDAELAKLATGYNRARHDAVRAELSRLDPLVIRARSLVTLADREPVLRAELAAAVSARDAAALRMQSLRSAVGDRERDDRAFDTLRASFEAARIELENANVALARTDAEAIAATDALARARAARDEVAKATKRLEALTRERRMHDVLDHTFTDLRTDLNDALRPELSRIAGDFLAQLTDGRYTELDLDDQYNLVVVEDGLPKPVISGGEDDLANLVLRLAISQMIAERAGQAFSLLILDEVFGSLDEQRRRSVVDLLRGLSDRFEQIILITHIADAVSQGCDQIISVEFDPASGASVVKQPDDPMELLVAEFGLVKAS